MWRLTLRTRADRERAVDASDRPCCLYAAHVRQLAAWLASRTKTISLPTDNSTCVPQRGRRARRRPSRTKRSVRRRQPDIRSVPARCTRRQQVSGEGNVAIPLAHYRDSVPHKSQKSQKWANVCTWRVHKNLKLTNALDYTNAALSFL